MVLLWRANQVRYALAGAKVLKFRKYAKSRLKFFQFTDNPGGIFCAKHIASRHQNVGSCLGKHWRGSGVYAAINFNQGVR